MVIDDNKKELFMTNKNKENINNIQSELYAKFFQGLANPTRYKIIEAILTAPKNVTQLVQELGLSQSQISNQLACLKWCGFVNSQQEGKYVYYSITDERIKSIVQLGRSIVADNAENISCCTRM